MLAEKDDSTDRGVKLPSASMKVARKSGTPTPWPIQPRSVRKEYTASAALAFIATADHLRLDFTARTHKV